jgi:hypothetical protein
MVVNPIEELIYKLSKCLDGRMLTRENLIRENVSRENVTRENVSRENVIRENLIQVPCRQFVVT